MSTIADSGSFSSSTSSFFSPKNAVNASTLHQWQRLRGHRRMSSYPETLLSGTKKQQLMRTGDGDDGAIEMQALPIRRLSSAGLKGQPEPPGKGSTAQKSLRGHRRIASAGPLWRMEAAAAASTDKPTEAYSPKDGEPSTGMVSCGLGTTAVWSN